jgi:hypothetical protein
MLRRVVWWKLTGVSGVLTASIIALHDATSQKIAIFTFETVRT